MTKVNWNELLGWGVDQIEDLRFVGYHYLRQGRYDISRSFFEALCVIQSQNPVESQDPYDYQTLGAIYLQLGDYARALRYLERALKLDPKDLNTKMNRCKTLFVMNRLHEARQAAKELETCENPEFCDLAQALQMAYANGKLPERMLVQEEESAEKTPFQIRDF